MKTVDRPQPTTRRVGPRTRRRAERMSRQVTLAATTLHWFTPDRLAELCRRDEESIEIDGYPSGGHEIGGSKGQPSITAPNEVGELDTVALDSSAEAAVFGRMADHRRDPVREAVDRLEAILGDVARQLHEGHRLMEVVLHSGDAYRGRQSSLQGVCCLGACEGIVSGVGDDRLRRGYCPACYKAWIRWKLQHPPGDDPGAGRRAFELWRAEQIGPHKEEGGVTMPPLTPQRGPFPAI